MGTSEFQKASAAFRQHLPDLSSPRFTTAKTQNPYEYADFFRTNHAPPWLFSLTEAWKELHKEPFIGVTSNGDVVPNLYPLEDEGVTIASIASAAQTLLSYLSEDAPEKLKKLTYPLNAKEWRAWSNPEILLRPFGLRLEEQDPETIQQIHAIISASLSKEGYAKAVAAMRINAFLGTVVELPRIMNEHSYNFLLFGTPSTTAAWGWSLYGHHLCLNVFLKGTQVVIAPTFTGAEPNIIDDGQWAGTEILAAEGALGLQLMQSLPPEQQARARLVERMHDPNAMRLTGDLKTDRWNRDDQRHLCGAFRDNRVVPYEGVSVAELATHQQCLVLSIVEQFLLYYPPAPRRAKMALVQRHLADTWFAWIGGCGDEDPYYFRIQSRVIVLEFDHHSGVFLGNETPAKFHVHTILRLPNGGDYGNALRREGERLG